MRSCASPVSSGLGALGERQLAPRALNIDRESVQSCGAGGSDSKAQENVFLHVRVFLFVCFESPAVVGSLSARWNLRAELEQHGAAAALHIHQRGGAARA